MILYKCEFWWGFWLIKWDFGAPLAEGIYIYSTSQTITMADNQWIPLWYHTEINSSANGADVLYVNLKKKERLWKPIWIYVKFVNLPIMGGDKVYVEIYIN